MEKLHQFYDQYDEGARLMRDYAHQTEFFTTLKVLEDHLKPKGRCLDIGAGTGIYAIHYAQEGHEVVAIDYVPGNVQKMQQNAEKAGVMLRAEQGDVRHMSHLEAESFDTILCLGPYYHLHQKEDRWKAIQELVRVLKPGGILAIAYINKYASYVNEVRRDASFIERFSYERYVNNQEPIYAKRDLFYFTTPSELEQEINQFSSQLNRALTIVDHAATDGISSLLREKVNQFTKEQYLRWLESYHFITMREPSLLGYSLHGLLVLKKME